VVLAGDGDPTAGRHPLPSPEAFAAGLGALGITAEDNVVAYDDTGGGTAGRLVWMLRAIGQRAAILDGGLAAWSGARSRTDALPVRVTRAPVAWPATMLQQVDDLDALEASAVVLDARAPERYSGAVEPVDPRAGHIPVASNLPWTTLLGTDGRLAPTDDLRADFAKAGISSATDLVASCGSGVTACMLLIAAEHAGLGSGRLFVPSFSGWSSSTRDVATL
jgi:thiosulfate/3-mercaptopyruvate sulfurtransferase